MAAAGSLSETIERALSKSRYLIVLCSPDSAQSRWVNREVSEFIGMGRQDRVLTVILSGEPNSTDPKLECFPDVLKQTAGSIAADVRPQGDGRERSP